VIATTFLPLTFITGYFGMNFGWMTEHIDSPWDFLVLGIGTLVASSIVLYAWFMRTGMIERRQRSS